MSRLIDRPISRFANLSLLSGNLSRSPVAGVCVQILMGVGASGMALGGLYAGGALTPGEVYGKPQAQVMRELSSMPVPNVPAQSLGGGATEVDVRQSSGSIGWHFLVGNREAAAFTATLVPEGKLRTRVTVSYEAGESISPEVASLTSTALMRSAAEIAMREQVDARLDGRPLNQGATLHAIGQHAANHPEQVREYGVAIQQMYKDIGNQVAENANGVAIEPDAQTIMEKATRPSVVP